MSTRASHAGESGASPKRARTSACSTISVFPYCTRKAMVVCPDTHVETWEEAWEIAQQKSEIKLFFDEERKYLLGPLYHKLNRLDRGTLHGNGCCRLVLGVKGIGKTTLLRLLVAANAFVHASTFCMYLQSPYNALVDGMSLIDVIRDGLNEMRGTEDSGGVDFRDVDDLLRALRSRQKGLRRLFLVVDEVDELFKVKEGAAWIRDLRRLANLDSRRDVYVVVSGSSAHLRSLFYALIPRECASLYPAYDGISCNNTKFIPVTLRRPQTIDDFKLALKALSPEENIGDDEVARLFIDCRGSLRQAQAELEGEYARTNAHVFEKIVADGDLEQLFRRLYRRVSSSGKRDMLDAMYVSCAMNELFRDYGDGEWKPDNALSFLYQCADEGYIDFNAEPTTGRSRVSFPHPAFYAMASSLDSELTFEEVVALLYPFSRHGEVVERLVLESFAQAKGCDWKSDVLKCTQAVVRRADAVDLKDILGRDRVESAVYKAANDCGVDGVAVKAGDDGTVEVVCIQVKMQEIDASSSRGIWKQQDSVPDGREGASRRGGTVDDIVGRMGAVGAEIESYCGPDHSFRLAMCLVTNRDVSEPAREYLAERNVQLVDRGRLYGMYNERVKVYVDRNRLAVHGFCR